MPVGSVFIGGSLFPSPSNTDVFYKVTFCVTKTTGSFQSNADGKVFLTRLSGARMCPNVYKIYGRQFMWQIYFILF